jgi:hypothetical protein
MLLVLAAEGYGLFLATYQGALNSANLYGASSCHECYGDLYASAHASSCSPSPASRNETECQLLTAPGGLRSNSSLLAPRALRSEAALQGAATGMCLLQNLLQGVLQLGDGAVANVTQGYCPDVLAQAADVLKLSRAGHRG